MAKAKGFSWKKIAIEERLATGHPAECENVITGLHASLSSTEKSNVPGCVVMFSLHLMRKVI